MGQVSLPMACIKSASGCMEYPGKSDHAMWSTVMARIASNFSSFPQSPRGCKTDWDMANS